MKMFLELPDAKCTVPRDGLRPFETRDMLFLASLLRRAGNARTFWELAFGSIVPERGSENVDPGHPSNPYLVVKARYKVATVRRWFQAGFYPFRKMLASGNASGLQIKWNGVELRSANRWKTKAPWALGNSLKWPFEKGRDPLLGNLHKIPLLDWEDSLPLSKGEVYCPLDGQVLPVKAEIITAPITWKHLCGRHWLVTLCPHCLGQIQSELIRMN